MCTNVYMCYSIFSLPVMNPFAPDLHTRFDNFEHNSQIKQYFDNIFRGVGGGGGGVLNPAGTPNSVEYLLKYCLIIKIFL